MLLSHDEEDFETKRANEFFERFGEKLREYSFRRALFVNERPKGAAAWHLECLHPLGGDLTIIVALLKSVDLTIVPSWQFRNYLELNLYTKSKSVLKKSIKAIDWEMMETKLDEALKVGIDWTFDGMVAINMNDVWGGKSVQELTSTEKIYLKPPKI